jgi:bacillopeptidase F
VDDLLAGDTNWELGAPSAVGPPAANSGANCYGTNLASNYDTDADIWLRSPAIDLTTAGDATLNYASFRDIEINFDSGSVRVLDAADNSEIAILESSIDGTSGGWELVSKALPPAALGKLIKIEFRFNSDNFGEQAGWYIDDVNVTVP